MFADVLAVVGALHYATQHNASAVRVFMDTVDYVDQTLGPNYWDYYWSTSTFDLTLHAKGVQHEKGVAWEETEGQAGNEAVPGASITDPANEVHFNGYLSRFGKVGSWSQVAAGKRNERTPFPLPNHDCEKCGMTFRELSQIARKFLKLNAKTAAIVDQFWSTHFPSGAFVVGAHFRGTDKSLLAWPFQAPTFSKFADEIEFAAQQADHADDFKVFLATDETEALEYFTKRFGNERLKYIKAPRSSSKDPNSAHGVHQSSKFSSSEKGLSAMVDMALLAKTNYLVKGRSGLSDVSLILGQVLEYQHSFYLGDQYIYRKNKNGKYEKFER